MKRHLPLVATVVISVVLTLLNSTSIKLSSTSSQALAQAELNKALISQEITGSLTTTREIYKVYHKNEFIGVLTNPKVIDALLEEAYLEMYVDDFPDSKIGLNEDMYIVNEANVFVYEDVDEALVDYIKEHDLFAVEVDKITFSNGAVIYVRNLDDFEQARKQYLLNFISEDAYEKIRNKEDVPPLKDYGYREVAFSVLESVQISKGLASVNDIFKDKNEIVYFLSYGYHTDMDTYVVEEYDTVAGVAYKNGLTTQQVLSINSDVLQSENQLLEVGMELNVTYFNSPINVVVSRERKVSEPVYPAKAEFIADSSLREGLTRVAVKEQLGSKDVTYQEKYINGTLVEGKAIASVVTKQPVREVVRYGTKVIPGIGSGNFRWPVNNPHISCGWYCYAGHTAIDIQDRYNRYGPVFAADRGVVVTRSYHPISGYYMIIDHQNGYRTYYGHFARPGFFPPGVRVEKGEVIGQIGMTGRATGPHVHFMVYRNGKVINPCTVLRC
ncbi:MAG: peptidoglycan DD-metalloendopeptidase family protein [Erysipelothrix sp.]|jgi:murein DD-endopeptidase MepM/ murein hydrolase activator NlpD|nr:peptidoglycan DD-metalloendopeptidase family protein [Erysipelothrix sp.]